MLDLPGPEIKPMSPALAGGFLTTVPPGKSSLCLLNFFQQDSFQCTLNSLVKFIPRYFILFIAIINGIVFLISLSVSSLIVYKIGTDFRIFNLYPSTLLYSFLLFLIVFWWSL